MTKLGVAVNPANYAVFYNYAAGKNQELRQEIDLLLDRGERLTREQTELLCKKYDSGTDQKEILVFQKKIREILVSNSEAPLST